MKKYYRIRTLKFISTRSNIKFIAHHNPMYMLLDCNSVIGILYVNRLFVECNTYYLY